MSQVNEDYLNVLIKLNLSFLEFAVVVSYTERAKDSQYVKLKHKPDTCIIDPLTIKDAPQEQVKQFIHRHISALPGWNGCINAPSESMGRYFLSHSKHYERLRSKKRMLEEEWSEEQFASDWRSLHVSMCEKFICYYRKYNTIYQNYREVIAKQKDIEDLQVADEAIKILDTIEFDCEFSVAEDVFRTFHFVFLDSGLQKYFRCLRRRLAKEMYEIISVKCDKAIGSSATQ